jgi:GNAT superfamily N-acetyltransferase
VTYRILPRSASHLTQCIPILAELHEQDDYPVVWPSDPATWLTGEHFLGAWVAMDGNTLLGHVGLKFSQLGDGTEVGEIFRLFVAPKVQRSGVGKALLQHGVNELRLRELLPTLRVVVEIGQVAAIYEHLGWRLHSSRRATHGPLAGQGYTVATYLLEVD